MCGFQKICVAKFPTALVIRRAKNKNKNPLNNATDTLVVKINLSLIQYNLFLTHAHLTPLIYLYSIEKQLFKNVLEVTCAFL